jgi:transposase
MSQQQIEVIKPETKIKYKKFCKYIIYNYSDVYFSPQSKNIDIIALIDILIMYLEPAKDKNQALNVKYTKKEIIEGIIDVLNNNAYWNQYKGLISGKYLSRLHKEFCKWGVYDCLYIIMLNHYYSVDKYIKLKHQFVDTTFIKNFNGTEMYGCNVEHKNKNGIKLSIITDSKGIPINLAIASGNVSDCKILMEQIDNIAFFDPCTKNVVNNNKYKQCLIGDAGYYSNDVYETLTHKGYTPITDVNKRNTKKQELLDKIDMDKKKYLKYQTKRNIIEHFNAWFHKFPKLDRVIEKST